MRRARCRVRRSPAGAHRDRGRARPSGTGLPARARRPPGCTGDQGADAAVGGVAGAYAYRTYCASCHGADGKGEGPLTENLRFRPADLTLIAKRNGGSFPVDRVSTASSTAASP